MTLAVKAAPAAAPEVSVQPQRGTLACWAGLGLCVLATGGDQAGLPVVGLLVPGAALLGVGLLRWRPWRGQGWM